MNKKITVKVIPLAYDLPKLHTRELLRYLKKARQCGGIGYDPTENHGEEIPIEEIKRELSTRPHIPNKIEGKLVRINKHNKGKRFNKQNYKNKR